MEASAIPAGGGETNAEAAAAAAKAKAVDANANDGKISTTSASSTNTGNGDTSEDFLIFGARPSHLFDDIAITIDSLLTEEVASLPLLPRTLTEKERREHEEKVKVKADGKPKSKPQTGEEKLISTLRKAYKKNLDLAEAYSSRNIFTVQQYSKTKRRKILESYLAEDSGDGEKQVDGDGKAKSSEPTPLPESTFTLPDGELPSPEQIMGMDKEILTTRQKIQHAKQRRIQLKRQLDRLNSASQTLMGVKEALQKGDLGGKSSGGGEGSSEASLQKLKETVTSAMEGHEELKVWNERAEEVLQVLDKIKVEREESKDSSGKSASAGGGNAKKVVGREADERERKRMLSEVSGGESGPHGTKEQVEALLKKLRGSK